MQRDDRGESHGARTPTRGSSRKCDACYGPGAASTAASPKTLIFAVNDLPHTSRADQIVDSAGRLRPRAMRFVTKITGASRSAPLQRIREFRNRPNPAIVGHGRSAVDRRGHSRP